MSYLHRISTRAALIPGREPASYPAIRSRSPVAEADQRIGVSDATFAPPAAPGVEGVEGEDSRSGPVSIPGSDSAGAGETPEPVAGSGPFPEQGDIDTTHKGSRDTARTASADRAEATTTVAADPSSISASSTGKPASSPSAFPGAADPDQLESRSTKAPMGADLDKTAGTEPSSSPPTLDYWSVDAAGAVGSSASTTAGSPEPQPVRFPAGNELQSGETPPLLDPAMEMEPGMAPQADTPNPGVVIDQLIVDVVPPGDDAESESDARRGSDQQQAASQTPVSLIGPLGRPVSAQVRFGLRHR